MVSVNAYKLSKNTYYIHKHPEIESYSDCHVEDKLRSHTLLKVYFKRFKRSIFYFIYRYLSLPPIGQDLTQGQ